MANQSITVLGWRETARALDKVNRKAKYAMFAGMRKAAEPIASDARTRLSGYRGLSTSTIQPSARRNGVFVTQRAKKVTGKRPDFGSLQMRRGLIPALDDHEDDVINSVEAGLGALIAYAGLQETL